MNKTIHATRLLVTMSCAFCALMANSGFAQEQIENSDRSSTGEKKDDEIVVTARLRSERLMDAPVAVTALGAQDLARYNAVDLTKIGQMTPTVIISNIRQTGGGSLAIRGISSPATNQGFEQAVSVAIDGVQSSSGRISGLGFFDLQQVEILKGPQTLFFGKNSPAGVISITTAGPTRDLEMGGRMAYEFVADELTSEGYISGPITETLGARLAVRYRDAKGWMYNDALPATNPFYPAALPAQFNILPGRQSRRIGSDELMARLTLQFEPTSNLVITGKLFIQRAHDQGSGAYAQAIGPCADGFPRTFGVPDTDGDCKPDNHTSYSDITPIFADTMPRADNNGRGRGRENAYIASLTGVLDLGNVSVTSITGAIRNHYVSLSGNSQTRDGGLTFLEDTSYRSYSQEFRVATSFDGPLNALMGAYYQSTRDGFYNDTVILASASYDPVTGRVTTYEKEAYLTGKTFSVFGQLRWQIAEQLELSGGLRYTSERKYHSTRNLYGRNGPVGQFNTSNVVFPSSVDQTPGVLAGRFKDSNLSPEITVSWHPQSDSTLYASYKTGFKSGGFGNGSPVSVTTTIDDLNFDSEKVSGFEIGAKGRFIDGRLRLTIAGFYYDFKNLQVTVFDPATIRYTIDNAGVARQRGLEIEGDYRASDQLKLRGALAYVHNRFADYTGQCYGYNIPLAQALTAPPPPGCSFRLNPNGTRFQTASGATVLQQVLDGRAPARSPDWSANAGFDFSLDAAADTTVVVTGDAFYSSSYSASDSFSPAARQDGFWRFNASVSLGDVDSKWRIALIGANLTNKYYLLFAGDRTGGASVPLALGEQRGVINRGREVTLSFR